MILSYFVKFKEFNFAYSLFNEHLGLLEAIINELQSAREPDLRLAYNAHVCQHSLSVVNSWFLQMRDKQLLGALFCNVNYLKLSVLVADYIDVICNCLFQPESLISLCHSWGYSGNIFHPDSLLEISTLTSKLYWISIQECIKHCIFILV